MSGVKFHYDILIIHVQFIEIILISFIEIIDQFESLTWVLRPSLSCARGGCPSRPTLATALQVKFGPSLRSYGQEYSVVRFLFIWSSGFGLMGLDSSKRQK